MAFGAIGNRDGVRLGDGKNVAVCRAALEFEVTGAVVMLRLGFASASNCASNWRRGEDSGAAEADFGKS